MSVHSTSERIGSSNIARTVFRCLLPSIMVSSNDITYDHGSPNQDLLFLSTKRLAAAPDLTSFLTLPL